MALLYITLNKHLSFDVSIYITSFYDIRGKVNKLQIVIEKKLMEVMTDKQHLFFNIISIQILTLVPQFHKSLETCGVKFF